MPDTVPAKPNKAPAKLIWVWLSSAQLVAKLRQTKPNPNSVWSELALLSILDQTDPPPDHPAGHPADHPATRPSGKVSRNRPRVLKFGTMLDLSPIKKKMKSKNFCDSLTTVDS